MPARIARQPKTAAKARRRVMSPYWSGRTVLPREHGWASPARVRPGPRRATAPVESQAAEPALGRGHDGTGGHVVVIGPRPVHTEVDSGGLLPDRGRAAP